MRGVARAGTEPARPKERRARELRCVDPTRAPRVRCPAIAVVAVAALSLLVWQPWQAKRQAVIANTALVHSPQFVQGRNAAIAAYLVELEPGGILTVSPHGSVAV